VSEMNVAKELRNEADGTYGRQPEDRYQRLLLVGADAIDDLEARVNALRAELAREKRVKAMLWDQIDLLKSEAKELAYWLMHPYVFVHERIIEDVDKDLAKYHGTATPAV
jgi:hypothetical protein